VLLGKLRVGLPGLQRGWSEEPARGEHIGRR
jgi:hypothetical protein